MTVLEALKGVLKLALIHDGLARGLREASKALDRRQAHMCVLNEGCEEEPYKKLVVALCGEHQIPLIKVPDGKMLGEWAGLCKFLPFFWFGLLSAIRLGENEEDYLLCVNMPRKSKPYCPFPSQTNPPAPSPILPSHFHPSPRPQLKPPPNPGVLDREGNARKVVNCSCVVVRDWGEESQERSILLNYFQTEQ
jgi:small subunit ribosomal protein S12e